MRGHRQGPGRRRRHRRPRRRVDRGPLGLQRGSRRAGDRRLPGADHLRRRPRDRRDDRRLRRRPARADAVGGRRDGGRRARTTSARASIGCRSGSNLAMQARLHRGEARLRALEARPGYAGLPGRLAMRGRHAAELTHELRRALRARLAMRERALPGAAPEARDLRPAPPFRRASARVWSRPTAGCGAAVTRAPARGTGAPRQGRRAPRHA